MSVTECVAALLPKLSLATPVVGLLQFCFNELATRLLGQDEDDDDDEDEGGGGGAGAGGAA